MFGWSTDSTRTNVDQFFSSACGASIGFDCSTLDARVTLELIAAALCVLTWYGTGKKTPGEPGHTRDTWGHTGTRITHPNLTTILHNHQPHQRTKYRYAVVRVRVGALVGRDGCEVRLCDPCARVSRVCPGSPGVFFSVGNS
jgi:hypothetical protein